MANMLEKGGKCYVQFLINVKKIFLSCQVAISESHCTDQRSQYLHWSFSPDTAKHKGNAFPLVTSEICRTEQQEFLRKASVLNPTESCHLAARTQPVVCRRGVLSSNSCAVCERQRLTSTSQHGTDAWHFRGAKEVIAFRWGGWRSRLTNLTPRCWN